MSQILPVFGDDASGDARTPKGDTQRHLYLQKVTHQEESVTPFVTYFSAYLWDGDGGDGDTPTNSSIFEKEVIYMRNTVKVKDREEIGCVTVTASPLPSMHIVQERGAV